MRGLRRHHRHQERIPTGPRGQTLRFWVKCPRCHWENPFEDELHIAYVFPQGECLECWQTKGEHVRMLITEIVDSRGVTLS